GAARFAGQWQQYVKAPIARFMAAHPDRKWPGLNLIVSGNVPVAAGLSSSSALVVAVAEAVCALTGLEMEPEAFAEICGEAEWYVGARGGAGDQAAMKFARQGCVVQLGFHPMRLERVAPWPDGWSLLVCNSGIQAKKSDGARNAFNQRVACYHIARELVRQSRPELADRVAHLRDLTPHRLGASDAEVAEIIAAIPEHLSRTEVRAALGAERADPLLASHQWPTGVYALRSVAMFGIAECERSRLCADRLEAGAVEDVGRMMNVSHAGDRVVGYGPMGKSHSDDVMADLIARCRSGAKLADEPGAYACSTPDIDAMVDTARRIPGVVGAQLSGAGLGGCMMVLARGSAVADAISALQESYYGPRGRPADVSVCRPVAGSGVLSL
ncbi:MAG: galactokinase, partial [Armatimonadetes bacterium]|nr:galactokinase [Armatimonadota bacterium]